MMELKDMTVPQRDNRIIALRDLIRTHEHHMRHLETDIQANEIGLDLLKNVKKERTGRLNELRAEKLLLEEEAAK